MTTFQLGMTHQLISHCQNTLASALKYINLLTCDTTLSLSLSLSLSLTQTRFLSLPFLPLFLSLYHLNTIYHLYLVTSFSSETRTATQSV